MRWIRGARWRLVLACGTAFVVSANASCAEDADTKRAECQQARDAVAHLAAAAPVSSRVASSRVEAERAKHASQLEVGLGQAFLERCLAAPDEHRACLFEAGSYSDVSTCRGNFLR